MPFRGKRSRRVRVLRRTRKAGRRPKGVSNNVKKYVKRAISSNLENKVYVQNATNVAINTAAGTTPTNIYLLPQVGQSVTQTGRIGNEIRIRKAYVKGYVNILPYNLATNPLSTPVLVKLFLVSCKYLNTNTLSSTNIASDFFDNGASSIGFQGSVTDMLMGPNKDAWTFHKTKSFELGATYASGSGAVGTGGYFDNSRMTLPFYFSYGSKFRGSLKFNDTGLSPTNRNLFLCVQAVYADSTTSSITPCEWHYQNRVEYEDA